jgi:hypothetical protein
MTVPVQPQNPQQGGGDPGKAPETQTQQQPPNGPPAGLQGQGDGGTGKAPKFEGEFDSQRAMKAITDLRGEVSAERDKRTAVEKQFTDFMGNFSKLFGGEEKQLTPEQIAQKAQQSDQAAREATVKLGVFQAASKHGADPDALLDSASFVRAISKLDPAADTFAANVESAIKKAVEASPRLKAQTQAPVVPAKGGVDMNGGTTGKRQLTAAEVKHLSETNPAALVKAREEGLLKDFLAS